MKFNKLKALAVSLFVFALAGCSETTPTPAPIENS